MIRQISVISQAHHSPLWWHLTAGMSIVFDSYINATQLSGLAGQISALLVTVRPRSITQRHLRRDLLKLGIAKRVGGGPCRDLRIYLFTHFLLPNSQVNQNRAVGVLESDQFQKSDASRDVLKVLLQDMYLS